jgi:PhoPQ-activated pathogenicity-related protein
MKETMRFRTALYLLIAILFASQPGCDRQPDRISEDAPPLLRQYVSQPDPTYAYELHRVIAGDGYTTHILRMVSGQWLTRNEVDDPEWWHWLHIVVPDSLASSIGMLVIGGGDRDPEEPEDADAMIRAIALNTHSIAISLHHIPNQPTVFVDDSTGERKEDELIAYAWRQFMENAAPVMRLRSGCRACP